MRRWIIVEIDGFLLDRSKTGWRGRLRRRACVAVVVDMHEFGIDDIGPAQR
ncbi:MAG: hypothetical protein NXI27_26810 [Alphaproteobacteria bacterium]|nr:hypothetical protein [Alphaproteobacteria bacterium]